MCRSSSLGRASCCTHRGRLAAATTAPKKALILDSPRSVQEQVSVRPWVLRCHLTAFALQRGVGCAAWMLVELMVFPCSFMEVRRRIFISINIQQSHSEGNAAPILLFLFYRTPCESARSCTSKTPSDGYPHYSLYTSGTFFSTNHQRL